MKNLLNEKIPKELLLQYAEVRAGELFTLKTSGGLFEKNDQLLGLVDVVKFLVAHNIKVYWCHGAGVGISELLNDFDRSGKRITPPEKMPQIVDLNEQLTQKLLDQLPEAKKIPYTEFLSEKISPDNATANFQSISPKGLQYFKENSLIISDHLGIDIQTSEPTNMNADPKASKVSGIVNANKLFFLSNVHGVLDDKETTIPDIKPNSINPDNYEGGMGIKMACVQEAALSGIDVHLLHQDSPEFIITDSLTPMGTPEFVTKISLEKIKEEWVDGEEINEILINQLVILIKHDPNLLAREKEDILENIENWHLLVEDRVIKGAFEIKKYKNIWEMGGLIAPKFMQGNHIGKKLFSKFEELKSSGNIKKAFALVKSSNKKGLNFFEKSKTKTTTPPKWLNEIRETTNRTYFEWQ